MTIASLPGEGTRVEIRVPANGADTERVTTAPGVSSDRGEVGPVDGPGGRCRSPDRDATLVPSTTGRQI